MAIFDIHFIFQPASSFGVVLSLSLPYNFVDYLALSSTIKPGMRTTTNLPSECVRHKHISLSF